VNAHSLPDRDPDPDPDARPAAGSSAASYGAGPWIVALLVGTGILLLCVALALVAAVS
jgi:hypothetical protein